MPWVDGYRGGIPKGMKPQPPTLAVPDTLPDTAAYIDRLSGYTPWAKAAAGAAASLSSSMGNAAPSALFTELETQALADVRRGGELSPEESHEAAQGARAAWGARGLQGSVPAAFGEVLNRVQYANARQDRARSFGQAVEEMRMRNQSANTDALGTLTGASTLGLGFAEGVRQFDQEREDSLTNDENSFFLNVYKGESERTAANKARRGAIFGGLLGGLGSIFGGGK